MLAQKARIERLAPDAVNAFARRAPSVLPWRLRSAAPRGTRRASLPNTEPRGLLDVDARVVGLASLLRIICHVISFSNSDGLDRRSIGTQRRLATLSGPLQGGPAYLAPHDGHAPRTSGGRSSDGHARFWAPHALDGGSVRPCKRRHIESAMDKLDERDRREKIA